MKSRILIVLLVAALSAPGAFAGSFEVQISPVVPEDIDGGAVDAHVDDAAKFAWEQFIALNWPALTTNQQRDVADDTLPFGDPEYSGPLVWHTFRHKSEVFPGSGDPAGYDLNAEDFGYSTLPPVYTYGPDIGDNGIVPACDGQDPVAEPSLINLDETTQIGLNTMFAGAAPTNIDPDVNSYPQAIRFLAQGNHVYFEYAVDPDAIEPGGDPLYTHPSCPSDSGDPGYDHTYCVAKRNFTEVSQGNGTPTTLPGFAVDFPAGTILVKGGFRELTAGEIASGRFYTTTVRYYEDIPESDPAEHCYHERVWGLVALHIIHKTPTSPNFVFSTFEQVDNLLTRSGGAVESSTGFEQGHLTGLHSTSPTLIYQDSSSGPTLTIVGDDTDPDDYCQPQTIGDRLFYLENDAQEALPSAGYICQNYRAHSTPSHILQANFYAQQAIQNYLDKQNIDDSPFLYYRLVNVQPEPFDKTEIQYKQPDHNRGSSIYYLANIMVETDYGLQHFSGRLTQGLKSDLPANFDLFDASRTTYQNTLTFDGADLAVTHNMGGCMGCHGVAQLGGNDFSFVLGGGRVSEPEAPEITPPGTSNPPPGNGQPTAPGDPASPGEPPISWIVDDDMKVIRHNIGNRQ